MVQITYDFYGGLWHVFVFKKVTDYIIWDEQI